MRKVNLNKALSNALAMISTKVAVDSTKKTCPMFSYQPKFPEALRTKNGTSSNLPKVYSAE